VRILFVSSELSPWLSTGGLGDAVAGLAHCLADHAHHDVTVFVPGTPRMAPALTGDAGHMRVQASVIEAHGMLRAGRHQNVNVMAWCSELFQREGLYGDARGAYGDNGWRFIAFARAAAYHALHGNYDVVVAHDWPAALSLAALRMHSFHPALRMPRMIQVVHNNAHQGRLPASCFALTGLAADWWHPDGVEVFGELSLLKAGLVAADSVVCVSPTYAREVCTNACGEGLEGLYQRLHQQGRLHGIVNGIDPARFPFHLDNKPHIRAQVLHTTQLQAPPHQLIVAIGRLAAQKGFDVLLDATPGLVDAGFSLAVLGDGDAALAHAWKHMAVRFPGRVSFHEGFDLARAQALYGAADMVMVPSRFEPCGLVQMLAQHHGAWPVAHSVGGLRDTIIDAHNGTLFSPLDAHSLVQAALRARASIGAGDAVKRLTNTPVSWPERLPAWQSVLHG
jgi:starch synthase